MAGRPTKLTDKLTREIAADIRKPTPPTIAAMRHGISSTTYFRWMAEGGAPDAPDHYRDFREAIDKAKGDAADKLLKPLRDSLTENSVEQAKYLLSHMFPEEFGSRQRVELTGSQGGPLRVGFELPPNAGDAATRFARDLGQAADADAPA